MDANSFYSEMEIKERYLVFIAIGYFCLATFEQMWAVDTLSADESQIYLWGRSLAWGYGPQPPLYSWLQWLVFQMTGETQFGVVVLRKFLTTILFVNCYFLVRRFKDVETSAASVLGLFLVYEISWLFLQDRTHNILVTALAPLVCIAFLNVIGKRSPTAYAWFGTVTGLSVLAKLSGIFLPVGLCLAALVSPKFRASILSRGFLISFVFLLLVLWGPVVWLFSNQDVAFSSSAKFSGKGWAHGLVDYGIGMAELFALPAFLVIISAFSTQRVLSVLPEERVLFFAFCIVALAIVPLVVVGDIGNINGRWLLPAFVSGVPLSVAWVLSRRGGLRWLPTVFGTLMALSSLLLFPSHIQTLQHRTKDTYRDYENVLKTYPDRPIFGPHKILGNVALLAPQLPIHDGGNPQLRDCDQDILLLGQRGPRTDVNRFKRLLKFCDILEKSADPYVIGGNTIWINQIALAPRFGGAGQNSIRQK